MLCRCAAILDTCCFLLQVSFGFLNNLLRVIKDMFDITEGGGPTLLELLNKASVDPHQHKRTDSECSLHSVIGKTNKKKRKRRQGTGNISQLNANFSQLQLHFQKQLDLQHLLNKLLLFYCQSHFPSPE